MVCCSAGGLKLKMRSHPTRGKQASLEQLEGRLHLSTTIGAVDLSVLSASAGQAVVVTITATSPSGVRAATLFRDVNANGSFDAGIDQPLGDIFVPNAQGKFVRTIVPGADWSRSTRLGINAVDTLGQWSATGARRVDLTVNQAPSFQSAALSSTTVAEGQPLFVRATATDDVSVRATSAFLDINGDGRWTSGSDIALGDSFAPDGNGQFTIAANATPAWNDGSGSVNVYIAAVDGEGAWTAPRLVGNVTVVPRPVISSFTADWASVQPGMSGNPLKLQVTASNAAAATFWLDLNGDGRWTAGTDFSLGDQRVSSGGTFTLYVPSDLAGRSSARVCADVVSASGVWASAPAGATVTPLRAAAITYFIVDTSGGHTVLTAEAQLPANGTQAIAQVSAVDFFADTNFNGVYEAGVDTYISSAVAGASSSGGGWRYRVTLTTQQIAALPSGEFRFYAAARMTNNAGSAISGPGATSLAHSYAVGETVITRVNTSIGGLSTATGGNAGDLVSVDVGAFSGATVSAITLFWDSNQNGRWDAGVDIHVAEFRPGSANAIASNVFTVALPQRAGMGAFAAAAVGADGGWSAVRTSVGLNVKYVAQPQALSTVIDADSLVQTVRATSLYGIRSVTGFIDLNNDGVQNAGESLDGYQGLLGGNSRDGVWAITIASGRFPGAGQYSLHLWSVDWAGTTSAELLIACTVA